MANSDAGTSSGNAGGQYQVFLNFCGRDTRDGFTSFLYRDLRKNGIHAFMDDPELRAGEEIGEELLRAIDDSQIYITIFSRNYAGRKWCLREFARMVDNTTTNSEEKKILPIFYYVEPDDVELKTPLYKTAIDDLKKECADKQQKFPQSWEEALKKAGKFKGWVLQKGKSQAELVDSVVEEVLQELKKRYKPVTKDLVGLDDRVAKVLENLNVNYSDEVRLLLIYGMGGIGKTTLARFVYNGLYSHFKKHCAFLDDIRETSKKEGLVSLQKKLLTAIDSPRAAEVINDVDYGRMRIEETLGYKKVDKKMGDILVVLNDVDKEDVDEEKKIHDLIGQHPLHLRTKVIITTRNASALSDKKDYKKVLIVHDDFDEEQICNPIGRHRLHPGTRVIITTRNTCVLGDKKDDKKVLVVLDDLDYPDENEKINDSIGRHWLLPGTRVIITTRNTSELDDKKFLIVLDDVDEEEQIHNLIGRQWLHPGTRVIITSRKNNVLKFIEQRMAHEMKEMVLSYEMKEMNFDDALQLFERHASVDNSKAKNFDKLSRDIVNTTGGLPLALKVIGSLLCGKHEAKWENTLKQLMKIPHKDVQKTLMISYKDLNYSQREIFLDIACFFINEDMTNANYMWEACGLYPNLEIDVLDK